MKKKRVQHEVRSGMCPAKNNDNVCSIFMCMDTILAHDQLNIGLIVRFFVEVWLNGA